MNRTGTELAVGVPAGYQPSVKRTTVARAASSMCPRIVAPAVSTRGVCSSGRTHSTCRPSDCSPGSVQISRFHSKVNEFNNLSAVSASALLKQFGKQEVLPFTSRKTRSALFQFPWRSSLKSRSCREHVSWSGAAPSTRNTASSTSCSSRNSAKNACAKTLVLTGSSFI